MKIHALKYTIWAADRGRAVQFSKDVFEAEVIKENPHVIDLRIVDGTLSIHGGGEGKQTWTGISFSVDDVIAGAKAIIEAGGKCNKEPQPENGEPPHLAMCEDTEGNQIMLSRPRS